MNNRQRQRAATKAANKRRQEANEERQGANKKRRSQTKSKRQKPKSVVPVNTKEEAEACIHNKGKTGKVFKPL